MEAILATLFITGFLEAANFYLDKFSWEHSFLEVNEELLENYVFCATSEDIVEKLRTNSWPKPGKKGKTG